MRFFRRRSTEPDDPRVAAFADELAAARGETASTHTQWPPRLIWSGPLPSDGDELTAITALVRDGLAARWVSTHLNPPRVRVIVATLVVSSSLTPGRVCLEGRHDRSMVAGDHAIRREHVVHLKGIGFIPRVATKRRAWPRSTVEVKAILDRASAFVLNPTAVLGTCSAFYGESRRGP